MSVDRPVLRPSDIAFTRSVKETQSRKGSRDAYQRMSEKGDWNTLITPDLVAFIARQRSIFLATVSSDGAPYIQHRGGPPGFLKVLDERTLGFADFTGNRQYITQGNLHDNPKAHLFLIDYERRARVKIWGEARFVESDRDLEARLQVPDYPGRVEQALLFHVETWDRNCPQHIPRRCEEADVAEALARRDARIAELEKALEMASTGRSIDAAAMDAIDE